jgi:hypothetical protein
VAPPSTRPDGAYTFTEPLRLPTADEIAAAPAATFYTLPCFRKPEPEPEHRPTTSTTTTCDDPGRWADYVDKARTRELARLDNARRPWVEGQSYWDQTTFEVACQLIEIANGTWNAYTLADAEADLFARAPRNEVWGESQHRKCWDSARKQIGAKVRPEPTDNLPDLPTVREPGTCLLDRYTISAADLERKTFPPLTYLVDRLLPVGGLVILAGPPKSGKSYLALGCAYAVATGTAALGELTTTGPHEALVISLDDQSEARAQRRQREVLRGTEAPAGLHLIHNPEAVGRGKPAADAITDYLDHHPACRLVVIDTLEHVRPRVDRGDRYSHDVAFLATLRQVIDGHPDVTLLVLHHTRKDDDGDDPIRAVSGTHGIPGGGDAILVLSGKRGAPRRMLDLVSRDGGDDRLVLAFTDHGLVLTDDDPDDPTIHMGPQKAMVYEALRVIDKPATPKDLEPLCPGVTNNAIGDCCRKLVNDGLVTKTGRGVYVLS